MSDLDDLLSAFDNAEPSGTPDPAPQGKGLRAQLEAVLAERKALQEQLSQLQTASRQRDLDSLFDKHSIPALAKDFFPKDAELTDKTAGDFIEKYGQLWGHVSPTAETPGPEQAAAAAMQAVAGQAASPSPAPMSQADYAAQFAKATNAAELRQIMESLGRLA
jgi:hypothetical protein